MPKNIIVIYSHRALGFKKLLIVDTQKMTSFPSNDIFTLLFASSPKMLDKNINIISQLLVSTAPIILQTIKCKSYRKIQKSNASTKNQEIYEVATYATERISRSSSFGAAEATRSIAGENVSSGGVIVVVVAGFFIVVIVVVVAIAVVGCVE